MSEEVKIPRQDKLTLSKVVHKVRYISDNQYNGNIYENIMLIFNQLSIRERTVLLRGLIGFCFIVENQLLVSDKDTVVVTEPVNKPVIKENSSKVESEIQDLNTINALELIKLKSWLFRTMTYVIVFSVISFIAFNLLVGDGSTPAFPFFGDMFSIVKMMMGLGG